MPKKQQSPNSFVINSVQGKKMQLLWSLGEHGIWFANPMELLEACDADRIEEVVQDTTTLKRHNPTGYVGHVILALTMIWTIPSVS